MKTSFPKLSENSALAGFLSGLKKQDGTALVTKEEANNLSNLKFSNGAPILSFTCVGKRKDRCEDRKKKDVEREFLYEIVWMLEKKGYQATYDFLSKDWVNIFKEKKEKKEKKEEIEKSEEKIGKMMILESDLMEPSRKKFEKDMEIYSTRPEVEMGEACKRCKSENTIAVTSQTRRADEAQTIQIRCIACGHHWIAQ